MRVALRSNPFLLGGGGGGGGECAGLLLCPTNLPHHYTDGGVLLESAEHYLIV